MTTDKTTLLGGLSVGQFLAEYWQKRPLLVRQAFPAYEMPITPGELAGLACEEDVESRLILEKDGESPWQLEHGPFHEERFLALPHTHWTLLVQEINKHVPEFSLLQDRFDFIPGWRLDDVMVSYAPDRGTVGPHADNYDVFLIQGLGRRRWQINRRAPQADELVPGLPLRIMAEFEAEDDWLLEPGDMLYLPPGVAHYGVAEGDSMTISVGFRAPQHIDMLTHFVHDHAQSLDEETFYADPDLTAQPSPGLIEPSALRRIREVIRSLPLDDEAIDRWFGRYITEPRPGHDVPLPTDSLDTETMKRLLRADRKLWRSEYCRFAYQHGSGGVTRLYVAGQEHILPPDLAFAAPLLCDHRVFDKVLLTPHLANRTFLELLCRLHQDGALYFDP